MTTDHLNEMLVSFEERARRDGDRHLADLLHVSKLEIGRLQRVIETLSKTVCPNPDDCLRNPPPGVYDQELSDDRLLTGSIYATKIALAASLINMKPQDLMTLITRKYSCGIYWDVTPEQWTKLNS